MDVWQLTGEKQRKRKHFYYGGNEVGNTGELSQDRVVLALR